MAENQRGQVQRVVLLSQHFDYLYNKCLPDQDLDRIDDFTEHFLAHGFQGLPGKLAPTWNVPGVDRDYHEKKQFAVEHYLWHYHIGIPAYMPPRNPAASYMTSDWVVHFQRMPGDMVIRLVDYDCHDPMHMPGATALR